LRSDVLDDHATGINLPVQRFLLSDRRYRKARR
jgi:hypothetical protein